MSEHSRLRALLGAATILAGMACGAPGRASSADTAPRDAPVSPEPGLASVDASAQVLANSLNQVVTGASLSTTIVGGERPPSLEVLQAARPGINPSAGLTGARAEALHEAALSFGARGGLAARGFAINEMLRRYEAKLDSSYDFHSLVVPLGSGQTLMRPPVITEAQMAFALGDGAQTARETGRVYQITREAQLASAAPNWRSYLVRAWVKPTPPPDDLRPRGGDVLGQVGGRGLGPRRAAGGGDLPVRPVAPGGRPGRHGAPPGAAARRPGGAAQGGVRPQVGRGRPGQDARRRHADRDPLPARPEPRPETLAGHRQPALRPASRKRSASFDPRPHAGGDVELPDAPCDHG
jgi:hypothetical protein